MRRQIGRIVSDMTSGLHYVQRNMSIVSPSPPLRELTGRQIQWIAGGYVLCLASMPGQTIFIAQFNSAIRGEFGLSHGEFGFLYTIATLASSVCLVWAGALADRIAPRTLGVICLFGLAIVALGMSQVHNIVALGFALFGLRFFGQGMMGHIAMTTMARWFHRFRGRALSFAQLGNPTGEALLPFVLTLAIVAFGWRQVWLGTVAVILLVLIPLVVLLFRDPPDGKRALARGDKNPDGDSATEPVGQKWTRGAVLRDPLFFMIIPGIMGPPAIGTLFVFHQAHLSVLKGWDLTTFTAFFPVLSISVVVVAIISGMLVDRFGAWRIVPFILIPQGFGCIILGTLNPVWTIPAFLMTFGMTAGMMSPVVGALWAELYGTAHIGTIRALVNSAFVFASAIGPGVAGLLIDFGVELDAQAFVYAAYCFGGAASYFVMAHRFRTRVDAMAAERAAVTP